MKKRRQVNVCAVIIFIILLTSSGNGLSNELGKGIDTTRGNNPRTAGKVTANEVTTTDALKPKQPVSERHEVNRFTGAWISSSDPDGFNVTDMKPDRTFHTKHYTGIELKETIAGRWEEVGQSIKWRYDSPPSAEEDNNPIISKSRDHFSVRETNGSVTNFVTIQHFAL